MTRRFALIAVVPAWMVAATIAFGQTEIQQPMSVSAEGDGATAQLAVDDAPTPVDVATPVAYTEAACDCEPQCGCEPSCECESSCCPSGCGDCGGNSCCLSSDCCLGDAWTLDSCIDPCGCCDHTVGGWIAFGYYDGNERLSAEPGDGFAFLDYPDHLNADQVWLYAEKVAEAGCCSAGWGYRVDVLYGVDAQKTQAFGNDDNVWDVSLDHGVYGWAIPQAYAEVAYGDWSVKVGHFFTLVGYEVVPATGNFFYSHSYTMFNSEPFTHTGVLGTYSGNDDVTFYAGWTLGWDTGFDQANGGSSWLGGFSLNMTDDVVVTYISTAGNFGLRSAGEGGYSQSVVAVADVTCNAQYVFQTDWVVTDGYFDDPDFHAEDYGINQYLFYGLNDCWKLGGRMEWWKSNTVTGTSTSFYELTGGVNYRAHANLVIRPEIRYNWSPTELFATSNGAAFNNTVFAIDAVATF